MKTNTHVTDTNYARLTATGLDVPLPEGWRYFDEGASRPSLSTHPDVDGFQTIEGRSLEIMLHHEHLYLDMHDHINPEEAPQYAVAAVLRKMRIFERLLHDHTLGTTLLYEHADYGQGPTTYIHVLYLDEGIPEVNFWIRAHEEFHAIKMIPGALGLLEQNIAQERGKPLPFCRIKDEELAADCNAVHGLIRLGFDLGAVLQYAQEKDQDLQNRIARAIQIYDHDEYSWTSFWGRRAGREVASGLRSLGI